MYLLSVIPISRGTPLSMLTYASSIPVAEGTMITVPVRKKNVSALVEHCRDAANEKAHLKSLGYQTKVLRSPKGSVIVSPAFMAAVRKLSPWYAATPGSILASLLPAPVLRGKFDISLPDDTHVRTLVNEQYILQAELSERGALYKSIVREEFARRRSVLCIVPSLQDIDTWVEALGRGITDYTHIIHGGLPPAKLLHTWKNILSADHPILIIGTPQALALPRADIGTIILDRESAGGYKTMYRPFIDYRRAAEEIARASRVRLIMGDQFLRIETLWRAEQGEFQELTRPKYRMLSNAQCIAVDLREGEQPATGNAAIISSTLAEIITRVPQEHARLAILGARKGYAPSTVCGDCGSVVTCRRCSSPVVLYKYGTGSNTDKENLFLCHRCGEKRSAAERCTSCNSWRLMPLGTGLDRAEEIIHELVPRAAVFRMDRDHVDSHKKAKEVMDEFAKTPGSILLGTEMMLPYLNMQIEYGALLSLQSLLTIPDIAMEEKAFRRILELRGMVTKKLILQTRDPDPEFYQWALQGNIIDCYRKEIAARKELSYPPFSVMVKLTMKGQKEKVESSMKSLIEDLKVFSPIAFPGFVARIKNEYRMHVLLSIPREKWPEPELLLALKALPPSVSIEVDPESLI